MLYILTSKFQVPRIEILIFQVLHLKFLFLFMEHKISIYEESQAW